MRPLRLKCNVSGRNGWESNLEDAHQPMPGLERPPASPAQLTHNDLDPKTHGSRHPHQGRPVTGRTRLRAVSPDQSFA